MKNRARTRRLECLAAYALLLAFLIFVGFPFIWMVATSFKYDEDILTSNLNVIPPKITFYHYVHVFTGGNLGTYFKNSAMVAGFTVILSFIAVIPAAYVLSILKAKTSHVISRTILLFQMMPGVLLLIPLYITMSYLNLINTSISLIISYAAFTIPFCFLFAKSYFDEIPSELFDSAFVDGCDLWRSFTKIAIPIALPGLMVTSVFSFILSWNDFMFANTFINSEQKRTLTIGIVNLQNSWDIQWGDMMAATAITVIPVLIAFVIANKYIIEGLTGAVKQ